MPFRLSQASSPPLPLKPSLTASIARRPFPAFFALLCAALVLLLGVVAVDGQLHARLHAAATVSDCGHEHADAEPPSLPHDETACAVDLFAAGVTVPLDPAHPLVEPLAARAELLPSADQVPFAPPAHILPPGRGPPRG